MANVNSSVLKERLKSKKLFLYVTVVATLIVDALLSALLISDGLAFTLYGIFVFVIAVCDVGLLVAVSVTNYKFKYARFVPTLYSIAAVILSGAGTVFFNLGTFYLIAMIVFAVFRLISALAVILGTYNGANLGGALKAVTCLFTVALLFVSCFYVAYAVNKGMFGQGSFGYRTVQYEYVADGDFYSAKPIGQTKGEKVVIAKEFNGKKVMTVSEDFFCDNTISEIYLECGAQFSMEENELSGDINENLKIYVDKSEVDDAKQNVIEMAKDGSEAYRERYMGISNLIIPGGLADDEVYVTFDYSYDDIEYAQFNPIKTWIGKKGDVFNLAEHASDIDYVEDYDLMNEEFLKANYDRGGMVLSPLRNDGVEILNTQISANMADINIHFEKIFIVTVDESCNDTLYNIYDSDPEFSKNGAPRYVLSSDPYGLLSGIKVRDGFDLIGWKYKPKSSSEEKISFTVLSNILSQDVTVSPEWALKTPTINSLEKKNQDNNDSFIYGDDVKFTVDAVSPADGVELSYEWSFNGAQVSGETGSEYTKTNINPKSDGGDQGTYKVKVTASSTTVTSLTSVSERSVKLDIGQKALNFNEWILPADTYTGLEQTVKASYVESDVINEDVISVNLTVDKKIGNEWNNLLYINDEFETVVTDAGSYKVQVVLTGDCADLYKIASNATANITINPYVIETLSWAGYEDLVYDGEYTNVTATAQGIGNDGELACTVQNGNNKDAGTYVAQAVITNNDLRNNYSIRSSTLNYTIEQREITLVWDNERQFTYDKADHSVQVAEIKNAVSGEESGILGVLENKTLANTASNPKYTATAKIVNKNYKFADSAQITCDFIINPKPVTISWSKTEFTYNGKEHVPTPTAVGLCPGDDMCDVTVSGAQINAGENYVATATALSDPNYIIAEGESTATCSFDIAKATLTPRVTDLTYNGLNQTAQIELQGLLTGDDCSAELSGATNKNAGNYTITIESLYGKSAANYKLYKEQVDYTIKKASLSLYAEDVDIVYGDELPQLTEISYVGFVQSENEELFVNNKPTLKCDYVQGNGVGKYDIEFTQSSYVLDNYEIMTVSGFLKVAKRQITVTVDDKESVYGDAAKELTATVTSGSVYNNEVPYALTCTVNERSSAGSYAIKATGTNNNYQVTTVDGTYTVTKKTITLDWGSKTEFTYEELLAFKPIASGIVNGDDVRISVGYQGNGSYGGEVPTVAGEYRLSVTLANTVHDNNYVISNQYFYIILNVPQTPEVAE